MMVDIPSRVLLTSLVTSLSALSKSTDSLATAQTLSNNPLRQLAASSRNLFLTAHCLLPSTFLAALDLLDKHLVIRCVLRTFQSPTQPNTLFSFENEDDDVNTTKANDVNATRIYYIRSSNPTQPRFSAAPQKSPTYNYEVRPHSWNCTCIAFTLSAYPRHYSSSSSSAKATSITTTLPEVRETQSPQSITRSRFKENVHIEETTTGDERDDERIWWGGATIETNTAPICKHLLAAILVERCPNLFEDFVIDRVVTVEEMAELAVLWD